VGLRMEKTEFFRNVLQHLENRVQIVDNRSEIFLAVTIGLLVAYGYIIKEFLYNDFGYAFLGIHIVFSLSDCFVFLQSLRPSRYFIWGSASPKQLDCEKYFFWPEHNPSMDRMLEDDKEFASCFQSLTQEDILENYQRVINVELKLVKNKYKFYRVAVALFKLLIVFDAVALLSLVVTQRIL